LKSVHRLRGFTGSLVQRKKLLLMKMKKGQSMVNWIGEVKEHVFNMGEAGSAVTEADQILAITVGLPAAYKSVISTFNATSPKDLTLDFVTTQLLNEEA
ncbi:hypothetical protein BDZ89DRAFT_884791, partial [Hymenopellis radicata]